MPTEDKVKLVKELKEKFDKSKSFFLTDFSGLNVQEITDLRKEFRANKIEYLVSKNTLIKLATQELSIASLDQYLEGPTGMAFSYDDPIIPAKVLYDFNKRLSKPKIKFFWVEGKIFKGDDLEKLAKLPTKEVLYANIVATLESVMGNLVGSLEGVIREFIGTIEAITNTREKIKSGGE